MPIIDLHSDTIDKLYHEQSQLFSNTYHIDLEKLRKGNYLAQWFALFVDTKEVTEPLMTYVAKMHGYFLQELEKNKELIGLATNFETYKALKETGKIAAFLSLEEGAAIGEDLNEVQVLYDMGVRMMTLTWNYPNLLGAPHSMTEGLTAFGMELADYLNSVKMLVDISHLSEVGVRDLASLYKGPIVASHCNAYGAYAHSRNLSDTTIRLVAETGGIIGANFYSVFLNGTNESLIDDLLRHIDHLYQVGGKDILALGTDFDGMDCQLEVCNAGKMDKLIERLSRKYASDLVDAMTYGNAERLIKENL